MGDCMKKIILAFCIAAISTGAAFAEAAKDKVYISANLAMSFENFSYDAFVNGAPTATGDDGKLMSGARYDFAAGYRLSTKVRAEAQYMIVSRRSFDTDKADGNVEYKASAVFANLIYDFWDMQSNFITPFVGAGIGVGSPNLKVSYTGIKDEAQNDGLAWQVQAGISVKLVDWLIVNAKYTYLGMPSLDKKVDGSIGTDYLNAELKAGVQSAGVGVSVLF